MGKKKHLAVVAHHVLCRCWICGDEVRNVLLIVGSVCLVWTVSRDIPLRWKSLGNGFRTRSTCLAPAELVVTTPRSACSGLWQALLPGYYGIMSAMALYFFYGAAFAVVGSIALLAFIPAKQSAARSGSSAEIVIRVCRRRLNSCRPVRLVKASADAASLAAIERGRR